MSTAEGRLKAIADALVSGQEVGPITVRDFIWWWYAERRSYLTVWKIRSALQRAGLETSPDFESTYLDAEIHFKLAIEEVDIDEDEEGEVETENSFSPEDPTYRISKLKAANQIVFSIKPEASLEEVITLMMERDISQIPVMTNERDVKGIVTWQTIGARLALGQAKGEVREFMEKAQISSNSESIFEIINRVVSHDYILVRGDDNRITGIITASDLSIQFRQLSEAFLILSEIENTLRILIERKFTTEDLKTCRDDVDANRDIRSVADLNFGEFLRLLQNKERWQKFGLAVDRVRFCESLDRIRQIRNDVMHFDPDGIPESDLGRLQDFSKFLRKILSIVLQ